MLPLISDLCKPSVQSCIWISAWLLHINKLYVYLITSHFGLLKYLYRGFLYFISSKEQSLHELMIYLSNCTLSINLDYDHTNIHYIPPQSFYTRLLSCKDMFIARLLFHENSFPYYYSYLNQHESFFSNANVFDHRKTKFALSNVMLLRANSVLIKSIVPFLMTSPAIFVVDCNYDSGLLTVIDEPVGCCGHTSDFNHVLQGLLRLKTYGYRLHVLYFLWA